MHEHTRFTRYDLTLAFWTLLESKWEDRFKTNIFRLSACSLPPPESSACADATLPSPHCVTTNVCDHMRKGVHVRGCTVGRTPSFLPPFFHSLSLFLLHHSTLPEAKPAVLFIRLSRHFFYSFLSSPSLFHLHL